MQIILDDKELGVTLSKDKQNEYYKHILKPKQAKILLRDLR